MQWEKNFPVRKRTQSVQGIVIWLGARQNFGILEDQVVKAAKCKFWKFLNLDLTGKKDNWKNVDMELAWSGSGVQGGFEKFKEESIKIS